MDDVLYDTLSCLLSRTLVPLAFQEQCLLPLAFLQTVQICPELLFVLEMQPPRAHGSASGQLPPFARRILPRDPALLPPLTTKLRHRFAHHSSTIHRMYIMNTKDRNFPGSCHPYRLRLNHLLCVRPIGDLDLLEARPSSLNASGFLNASAIDISPRDE